MKITMTTLAILSLTALLQFGCANVKLVSSNLKTHKFCTNPNNKIAKDSDFDEAAYKQCGGGYRFIGGGMEFFTDPKSEKIAGFIEVQKEQRMCRTYECY